MDSRQKTLLGLICLLATAAIPSFAGDDESDSGESGSGPSQSSHSIGSSSASSDPFMSMPADTPNEIRAAYNDGISLHSMGNHEEAAKKFEEVSRALPNFVPAHLGYASSLEKNGRMSESLSELETAARLKPDDQTVLHNLGRAYQLSGRRSDAIRQFERYLWLYPEGEDADYLKNAIRQMKGEEQKKDVFADSSGQNSYLREALAGGATSAKRWNRAQMPLAVFIHSGQGIPGFKGVHDTLLRQAFAEWAFASAGKVSFKFTDKLDGSQIECKWTNNVKDFSNPIEAGETQNFGSGTNLSSSTILLLSSGNSAQNLDSFKGVCLHEIGHALGITGHSSQASDIMFMFAQAGAKRSNLLSERDKRTLIELYTMPEAELAKYVKPVRQMHAIGEKRNAGEEAAAANNDGIVAAKAGKLQDACNSFEEAVRLSPNTPVFHENLGNAYIFLGRQELSTKDYDKYQKHFELAAKHLLSGRQALRAAETYEALSKFSTIMKNESDARRYGEEAGKIRREAQK